MENGWLRIVGGGDVVKIVDDVFPSGTEIRGVINVVMNVCFHFFECWFAGGIFIRGGKRRFKSRSVIIIKGGIMTDGRMCLTFVRNTGGGGSGLLSCRGRRSTKGNEKSSHHRQGGT